MAFLEWGVDLSVDIASIDEQHKKLIELVNKLHDAMRAGKGNDELANVFSQLLDYTDYHFKTEQTLFEKHGYPDRDTHQAQHDALLEQVRTLQDDFTAGKMLMSIKVMDFLRDWVTNHIKGTDKKYSSFLKQAGVT